MKYKTVMIAILLVPVLLISGCTSQTPVEEQTQVSAENRAENSKGSEKINTIVEDNPITSTEIKYGDDGGYGKTTKNKLTNTYESELSIPLNDTQESLTFGGTKPVLIGLVCGVLHKALFNPDSLKGSPFQLQETGESADSFLGDAKASKLTISFFDKETNEPIVYCIAIGPTDNDLQFNWIRNY